MGILADEFLAALRDGLPDPFPAPLVAGREASRAADRLAALLVARAARALRTEFANAAGPNLSIFFGCMPGSIWALARDRTTPIAHSDISRAEPP
ncbi:hypothetical protein SRABI26_00740 [Arthrobacter sp. Bi26]|nr:hypothetical protein SRABI26_00740 [Arthrobacter sp. Bi26]